MYTVRVMLSSGGALFTDLKEPTHTVTAAVRIMLKLAGTLITAGATATTVSSRCDHGQGSFSAVTLDSASVIWLNARSVVAEGSFTETCLFVQRTAS